jgi:thiol-disulfide isomerase/thioredoxin
MPRAARRTQKMQKKKRGAPSLNVRNEADVKKALNILKSHPLTVVLVFANWCPHCHSYMPTWNKLSKTPNRSAPMIAVEQQYAEPILNSMGTTVEGYPTVFAATRTQNASQPNVGEPITNPREEATMQNLLVNGNYALGNQPIPNGKSIEENESISNKNSDKYNSAPVSTGAPLAMSNEPVTLPTVANSIRTSNKLTANSRRLADSMLNSGMTSELDLLTPPAKESMSVVNTKTTKKSIQAGGNPAATGTLFEALSSYSAGSAVSKLASIAGLLGTYHLVSPTRRRVRSGRSSRSARRSSRSSRSARRSSSSRSRSTKRK